MKNSLPKLNLDLKSRSPDLEIIDLDADSKDDKMDLDVAENDATIPSRDRNNNSNSAVGAADGGEQLKKLDRCFFWNFFCEFQFQYFHSTRMVEP